MNINIVISGNLAGFARFYVTPEANEILAENKFTFDNYNHLSFLKDKEKAYAVSFSPRYIAVSLISGILDSFRRPGTLVVSVLLPRKYRVESVLNARNEAAMYQLLNELNNRFYEKNFVDGMVNQNIAVLMQDYYADILSQYQLVADDAQSGINISIDLASPTKRVGYVAAAEGDMPKYLYTLCRKSYESYHHVFFAANAPQNIDEEPEEVKLYNVYIKNRNMHLPKLVKLSDRIHQLQPEEGEKDINKDYTYQEVLSGVAEQIYAEIVNDTVEISYRFVKEERTIYFSFVAEGNPVSIAQVMPVISYPDGTKVSLPSDTYTFQGKEIFQSLVLDGGSRSYRVKAESSVLDVSKLRDGATFIVQVEACDELLIQFAAPNDKPKKITVRRTATGKTFVDNVTVEYRKIVPGRREEWEYTIESDYYETIKGNFGVNMVIPSMRPKQSPASRQNVSATSEKGTVSQGVSSPTAEVKPANGSGFGGRIRLHGFEDKAPVPQPERKLNYKKIGILAFLFLAVGLIVYWITRDEKQKEQGGETQEEEVVVKNDTIVKKFQFTVWDVTNDPVPASYKDSLYLSITSSAVLLNDKGEAVRVTSNKMGIKFSGIIRYLPQEADNICLFVNWRGYGSVCCLHLDSLDSHSTDGKVYLTVLASQLETWVSIKHILSSPRKVPKKDMRFNNDKGLGNHEFEEKLKKMYESIEWASDSPVKPQVKLDLTRLDAWDVSIDEFDKYDKDEKIDGIITVKQRKDALLQAFKFMKNAVSEGTNASHLSTQQQKVYQALNNENRDSLKNKEIKSFEDCLKVLDLPVETFLKAL